MINYLRRSFLLKFQPLAVTDNKGIWAKLPFPLNIMCPFEIDLKGICSISLLEFRNFKIAIGLESRGFLVPKKKKKKPKSKEQNQEMMKKDRKRRRWRERENAEKKIAILCVYPYVDLSLLLERIRDSPGNPWISLCFQLDHIREK